MAKQLEGVSGVLDRLVQFLVFETSPAATTIELLDGFARRLCAEGFDLIRMNLQVRPLSPHEAAVLYVWRPTERQMELSPLVSVVGQTMGHELDGAHLQVTALAHGAFETAAFRRSPLHQITIGDEAEVRCPLAPGQTEFDFPILKDLAEQGASDYIAFPLQFYGSARSALSFATRKPGGFTERDLALLREVRRPLLLALSPRFQAQTTRTLLSAYVGPKTAELVLSGKVERGDVTEIDAAIWFSDLRGFTPMSAGVASATLIGWLNDYFAAIGRAIVAQDGEILKFIGDAVLAVWPVSEARDRQATCRAALAAAQAANAELNALNARRLAAGLPAMEHGIGLHVGSAQYGNIGAEGRHDFTVIGQAVNTASRLESTCAKLARRLVASAEFAEQADAGLVPLGTTELKGVSGVQAVFGVKE